MKNISLIDQLKELEQEHRDLDEILIQLQEKQTVSTFVFLCASLQSPHTHLYYWCSAFSN